MDKIKNNRLPIMIFHKGNPEYLEYVINQAEKKHEVHLLGDSSNKKICKIWAMADSYIPNDYYEFENNFKSMSDYPLEFDLNCFKRFFIMKEYMEKNNLNKMVFVDSDLLLYIDLGQFFNNNKCKVSLSIPKRQDNYRWTAQAHCSYWSLEYLTNFLEFCIYTYKNNINVLREKYEYHITHNLKGGVCDMTLLYLWSKGQQEVLNMCEINDNAVFDHCMGSSSNYEDDEFKYNRLLQAKKVVFDKHQPFFISRNGIKVKANTIHCQGSAKAMINSLLSEKPNSVSIYIMRYCEVAKRFLAKIKRY